MKRPQMRGKLLFLGYSITVLAFIIWEGQKYTIKRGLQIF